MAFRTSFAAILIALSTAWLALPALGSNGQLASSQAAVELVVVANLSVPPERFDHAMLQNVFLRRQLVWSNNQRVLPINYTAGNPLRTTFDRAVHGFTPKQTARYWIDARIRNGTEAPRAVSSPALLARVIPRLPGSIGYLPADQVPPGVRVVARVENGRVRFP